MGDAMFNLTILKQHGSSNPDQCNKVKKKNTIKLRVERDEIIIYADYILKFLKKLGTEISKLVELAKLSKDI